MTPAELLALADAATPGPWEHRIWGLPQEEWPDRRVSVGRATQNGEAITISPRYGELEQDQANARLIALAPDLAWLVAEMATLLEYPASADGPGDEFIRECRGALAKLSELETRA